MILRIRTNLGTTKITIENEKTTTLQQLLKIILEKLNISNINHDQIILTSDLAGERPLAFRSLQQTLAELGLKHGDEVFIKGKFEEIVIEKSYINDQHELVQAGKSLKYIEEGEGGVNIGKEEGLKISPNNANSVKKETAKEEKSEPLDSSLKALPQANSGNSRVPVNDERSLNNLKPSATVPTSSATYIPPPAPIPSNDRIGSPVRYEDDEGIRAPDDVQRMRLIDFPSPSNDFSSQEMDRLNEYRQQLREAGLKEYEIETMLQEMKDEMLAERLRRQMSLEDRLSAPFTTLDQLEQLLANHRRRPPPFNASTNSRSVPSSASGSGLYRPDYQRNATGATRNTSNGHKRKLIDEFKLNQDDSVPIRSNRQQSTTSSNIAAASSKPSRLQGAGERIVQSNEEGSKGSGSRKKPQNTFNTPDLMTSADRFVNLVDDEEPSLPLSSLRDSGYQAMSSIRDQRNPSKPSNDTSLARTNAVPSSIQPIRAPLQPRNETPLESEEDVMFEEMMRKAIEESKKEAERVEKEKEKEKANANNPRRPTSIASTGRQRSELASFPSTLRPNPSQIDRIPPPNSSRPSSYTRTNGSSTSSRSIQASTASSSAKTHDAINDRKISVKREEETRNNIARKPSGTEAEENESIEDLLKIQQQLDEEAARELQESEDLAFARYQERENDRNTPIDDGRRGIDSDQLRNALHFNDPLPSSLHRRMNEDLTDDLLELMRLQTAEMATYQRENPLFPTHHMDEDSDFIGVPAQGYRRPLEDHNVGGGGLYDEDDEQFALALQNSLNER
mmetsp:Transcript_29678/g.32307  ORF Transcript_29678/g.32307 Transcript_29678/m.32307 type:complete len:791 (+) Transcript_29678:70-2442(+)